MIFYKFATTVLWLFSCCWITVEFLFALLYLLYCWFRLLVLFRRSSLSFWICSAAISDFICYTYLFSLTTFSWLAYAKILVFFASILKFSACLWILPSISSRYTILSSHFKSLTITCWIVIDIASKSSLSIILLISASLGRLAKTDGIYLDPEAPTSNLLVVNWAAKV